MGFSITSAKLTGNPGPSGWVQVHDFTSDSKEKIKTRGRLFAVIAICNQEEGISGVISGREILARLHEEYFGNTEASAFNALKDSVLKVIKEFGGEKGRDVEIGAASFVGGVVYSSVGGGAQASIFRNGMLAKILVSKEGGGTSASGYPKPNDIFVLGTGKFFGTFTEGVLKAALESDGLDRAVENLAPTVHSVERSSDLGAVFISFKTKLLEEQKSIGKSESVDIKTQKLPGSSIKTGEKLLSILGRLRERLPSRRIYVRKSMDSVEDVKGKKTAMSAGLIMIILLIVSIAFGVKQKRDKDFRDKYVPRLNQAQHNYEEASKLLGLDGQRARELFLESKTLVDSLVAQGIEDPELSELKRKIDEGEGIILGKYSVNPELFIDLTLFREDFSADLMRSGVDRILVLDSKGKRIVGSDIATKRTTVVSSLEEVEGATDMASFEDRAFVIASEGIFEVGDKVSKISEKDWQGSAYFYSYAANLYVLDKEASSILRYPAIIDGFAPKQNWLAAGIEPNFDNVTAWTIDGSIWAGFDNGKIMKFTQGSLNTLNIKGVVPEINQVDDIYTNEENKFVYVLDKTNLRIVVLDKDGNFKAQYISDALAKAKNISASEKNQSIIFLGEESKLNLIKMKHL